MSDSNSNFTPNKKQKKQKKQTKHCQQLPVEIWEQIFSHTELPLTLFNLQLTCSRFNQILKDPSSECWINSAEFFIRTETGRLNSRIVLKANECISKIGARTVMTLVTSNHCQLCKTKTWGIYWNFKKKLCPCCAVENTISKGALEYAFPNYVLEGLASETLRDLRSKNRRIIHDDTMEHYWYDDLMKLPIAKDIAEGYVFEDYGGVGKDDYMTRKFYAVEHLKTRKGIRTEMF